MKVYTPVVINMNSLCITHEESYEYKGEVALCKGPSGIIDYPDYMEKIHVNWLTGGSKNTPAPNLDPNLEEVMNAALSPTGNPYSVGKTAAIAYNPGEFNSAEAGSPLSDMQLRHDASDTLITALDDEVDYAAFVDRAITKVDESYVTEAQITTLITTYETEARSSCC